MANAITWLQNNWLAVAPWAGWLIVEIRSLVPAWKTSGVLEFILSMTGYKGDGTTVPKLPGQ